jgi:predicted DNA-binding transcriptional regulator AlpA
MRTMKERALNDAITPIREIVRMHDVRALTGYSNPAIHAKARDAADPFPSALVLGPNAVGFYRDEIEEWLAARPRTK